MKNKLDETFEKHLNLFKKKLNENISGLLSVQGNQPIKEELPTSPEGNAVLDSGEGFNFLFKSEDGPAKELGYGSFEKAIGKLRSGGKPVRIKRGSIKIGGRTTYNIIRQLIVNSENKPVAYLVTANNESNAQAVRSGEITPKDLSQPFGESVDALNRK